MRRRRMSRLDDDDRDEVAQLAGPPAEVWELFLRLMLRANYRGFAYAYRDDFYRRELLCSPFRGGNYGWPDLDATPPLWWAVTTRPNCESQVTVFRERPEPVTYTDLHGTRRVGKTLDQLLWKFHWRYLRDQTGPQVFRLTDREREEAAEEYTRKPVRGDGEAVGGGAVLLPTAPPGASEERQCYRRDL